MRLGWMGLAVVLAGMLAPGICGAAEQEAGGPLLAQDGQARYQIAVAPEASSAEKTAASELAAYLGRVTGAEFAIVTPEEAAGKRTIAVGPGAGQAVAPDLDLTRLGEGGLGDDGIVMKTVDANLVLTGAAGSKRGTLYAVYEFLERVIGVRWWSHTEEFVPTTPTLHVEPLDVRYRPGFLYREVFTWSMVHAEKHWGYDDADAAVEDWPRARFAARLRNNGHGTAMPASLGGCYMPLGWCHTYYPFMPPEKYFAEHPDWYSEIDGVRKADGAQLCMTNDAMLAVLTQNVLAKVREQPHLGMVVVTMNDWWGNCRCSTCAALDDAEGSAMASVLYGVNKVAEAVEAEFPEVLVATHAYVYARKPPKTVRPRDNVLIWLCVIERSATQPIDSDANRQLMEDLEGWSKAAPRLFVWDYTMSLRSPLAPYPNQRVFGPDFRAYRDNNTVGVFCEGESVGVSYLVELRTYLMAHLLWDPSRDEQAIIDEFLTGYYGPAAAAVRAQTDLFADSASDARLAWHGGPDAPWLDLAAMNQATELADQAEAAVADDPVLLARVRRTRLALDHQWLRGYSLYRDQAAHTGLPFLGPPNAVEASADFAARVTAEVASWPVDYMPRVIPAFMGQSFADYLAELEVLAKAATAVSPLPAMLRGLPADRVVDLEESRASIFPSHGASLVDDPLAANGLAMRLPKDDVPSWAVQAKTERLPLLGGFGRYRVYAVIRCEVQDKEGSAFVGGLYDGRATASIGDFAFPIGQDDAPGAAQGRSTDAATGSAAIANGEPVPDAAYHLYDFGAFDLPHDDISVWVGTTTSDIFVDRFVFVREP